MDQNINPLTAAYAGKAVHTPKCDLDSLIDGIPSTSAQVSGL